MERGISMKYPAEPLTPEEVGALIGACSVDCPTGIRNRALIVLLYRGGLRISEALDVEVRDFDPGSGSVRVRHGKLDKSRVVGLGIGGSEVLRGWLVERRVRWSLNGHQPVFCTSAGKRLLPSYVRALLPRLARKAGIAKRVHAHGLRHTMAFELANEGVPLHVIQAQLGHASLAVTDRYVRHLSPVVVVEAMSKREWRL